MSVALGLEKFTDLRAVIWTTTPWTLPANQAVAVHPTAQYCVVTSATNNTTHYIVAAERVAHLSSIMGAELQVVVSGVSGEALGGCEYHHPFLERSHPILTGTHVTMDTGTGLVHSAPRSLALLWFVVS